MMRHGCNAYCRNGSHCDLVYACYTSLVALGKMYSYLLHVDVLDIQVAREAPPIQAIPREALQSLTGQIMDGHRYLVWWRRPEGRWSAPTTEALRTLLSSG